MRKKILFIVLFFGFCLMINAQGLQIDTVIITPENRYTARGNTNELMMQVAVLSSCNMDSFQLQSLELDLTGTTYLDDIETINIYSTGSYSLFNIENASLIGSYIPTSIHSTYPMQTMLDSGIHYLWITMSVAENAEEGNIIKMTLNKIIGLNDEYIIDNQSCTREILLVRKLLYAPGDFNSANYRIPAIITAKDGSLVVASDKRKYNQSDLPEDIDILINRSVDGGKTWSLPYTLAQGTGRFSGYGDAALVQSNDPNGLMCVFVGGPGLSQSTSINPIRSYMCKSIDNGISWTQPVDITHFIFGSQCEDPIRKTWKASFFASGNGLKTSSGRIMFVAAIRQVTNGNLNNYVVYSDDNGVTWQISGKASSGGDEAKIVELTDGRILMSIRHQGARWYNISYDGGETWQNTVSVWNDLYGPACNGDMIRYTSVNQGFERNRILHSLPNSTQRENVSLSISYDEGSTWETLKKLVFGGSAYSSICILPDGTIGAYIEENYHSEDYSLYFINVSLDWLTDGNDHFLSASVIDDNSVPMADFVRLFPNPAAKKICIEGVDLDSVQIFSVGGNLFRSYSLKNKTVFDIDVSNWNIGSYIFVITNKFGKTISKTMVVSH